MLWDLLTDLWDFHRHGGGYLLRRHMPPSSSRAAPSSVDIGSDPTGVKPSVLAAHPRHPQLVLRDSSPLQGRLPSASWHAARGRVGDHHAAAVHGDEFTAVGKPAHFQGEGSQVVREHGAEQGQRVTGQQEQGGGGGRGGGWSFQI